MPVFAHAGLPGVRSAGRKAALRHSLVFFSSSSDCRVRRQLPDCRTLGEKEWTRMGPICQISNDRDRRRRYWCDGSHIHSSSTVFISFTMNTTCLFLITRVELPLNSRDSALDDCFIDKNRRKQCLSRFYVLSSINFNYSCFLLWSYIWVSSNVLSPEYNPKKHIA